MSDRVAVVGAGTMGSGIAQVALEAGFTVTIVDTDEQFFLRGINTIKSFIGKKVEKGKLSREQYEDIQSRLSGTTDMAAGVAGAVMVVEAVYENLELKKEIFRKLDALCPENVILASNTSTMSISEIAAVVGHPDRVIGTHYFSPVPLMRLVEIVKGEKTSEDIVAKTMELCRRFGKTPIAVKDVPGFIVNRYLCLMYNEAANMVYDGVAEAGDIDSALKLGCNWPMGVCQIMDMAGVDITCNALQSLYAMTGEERYKPSPLFEQMLEANTLGQKTGKGFYEY
ncbi:MAG: 3-hydroxyacyl-CoA dehydrogenase family protein [Deltaproteobacteria bacterium]|nr:3-hydroxyacyl-CoA dehydrogenase family protein [Deltaproteobacteria bacterium]